MTLILTEEFLLQYYIIVYTDPNYFNIPSNEIADTLADLSAIEQVVGLAMKPIAGMAMDLFGRKNIVISAIFTVMIYTISVPWFKHIYPWFCIWKLTMYGFLTFVFEAPFLADYI